MAARSLGQNRAIAVGVLIEAPLIVIAYFVWLIGHQRGWAMQDFAAIRSGASAVLEGSSPYPAADFAPLAEATQLVYPAFVAYVFVPFALLPYKLAAALFFALLILSVPATLLALGVRDWRCYGLPLLWYPMIGCFNTGAIGPLLVLLVALAWRYRRSAVLGPVLLAVAITAKLFLWPLLLWFVVTRRWRQALVSAAATAFLLVVPFAPLGWQTLRDYPKLLEQLESIFGPVSYSADTLFSALGAPAAAASALVGVLALALLVLLLAVRNDERAALTVALAAALLLSPIVWSHYYVLLLVPVALARPRLSGLWFLPLLYWLSPIPESSGELRRLALGIGVTVLVLVLAGRRMRPAPEHHAPPRAAEGFA